MKIRSSEIASEQVRLLLFKECDWRGRKLLFDSSTVEKVAAGKYDKLSAKKTEYPSIVEVSDGYSYVYNGPAADSNLLGEMIFGAVAMNYKGVSLKIHIMDEPRRLMCTKVFCVPGSRRASRVDRKNGETNSCAELRDGSKPLSVPSKRDEGVSLSFSLNRGDSGFYGDSSPFSSMSSTYDYFTMFDICKHNSQEEFYSFHSPLGRKLSTTSNGSWQRRTFQNIATRFDLGHRSSSSLSVPTATSNISSCDSQLYSNSSACGTCDSLTSTGSGLTPKKSKLGLALLITVSDSDEMDVVRRCVEHSPQLQALVCRLRIAALTAGSGSGSSFVATLYRATADAAVWLSDLMHGPRLQPVWLNLATSDEPRLANKLAETLLTDLCSVLSIGDTKHTNFFVSTLLTYVLTYHLGWVTTVSPYDIIEPQNPSECRSEAQRPYNALWAQLSDLCGAIGFPPRVARTIICGSSNVKFINRLLLVLTYFLRCGDVNRIDYKYQDCALNEGKIISVENASLKRTASSLLEDSHVKSECQNLDSTITLKSSEVSFKRTTTLANLSRKLSTEVDLMLEDGSSCSEIPIGGLKRNPTVLITTNSSLDSSLQSSVSEESDVEQKVVFVLGDNEKLVGLKNKSGGGKSVKKSSKIHNEVDIQEKPIETCTKENCKNYSHSNCSENPSKCCRQTLQHSKPIKHSGFKFEFDKYPQIVTNYMKSKNLEILDRHYIGKPGNLKLDNFQFDPTIVPPIQEERCEICYKCQLMESTLQTPTNASELEYMNDVPRQSEPQYAKETIVEIPQISPKIFIKRRKENTLVVNIDRLPENVSEPGTSVKLKKPESGYEEKENQKENKVDVKQIVEFPLLECLESSLTKHKSGFDGSLLGGITDHYVPDLILQGTTASPNVWETDLRRDIDLASHLNKNQETSPQALAIIGDTNTWEVRVAGRSPGAGGMSALVAAMLDALPAMWRARVPPHQCLTFLEGKLREFCVLSKTLADMLMSTDFCDIVTLTKSLNIDVNDVPLLLAVATTHTPQVATRYGISYR